MSTATLVVLFARAVESSIGSCESAHVTVSLPAKFAGTVKLTGIVVLLPAAIAGMVPDPRGKLRAGAVSVQLYVSAGLEAAFPMFCTVRMTPRPWPEIHGGVPAAENAIGFSFKSTFDDV